MKTFQLESQSVERTVKACLWRHVRNEGRDDKEFLLKLTRDRDKALLLFHIEKRELFEWMYTENCNFILYTNYFCMFFVFQIPVLVKR